MSSRISHGQARGTTAPRCRTFHRSGRFIEAMESRLLLAGVNQDLTTLIGRFYKQGSVFGSDTDAYHFHLPQPGEIDVQLSRLIGTGLVKLSDSGGTLVTTPASTKDRHVTFQAPSAGD
ncbi:MAG TPA: hypothetical protein VH518_12655, partial [Tepidisphaeraceae bacterium]